MKTGGAPGKASRPLPRESVSAHREAMGPRPRALIVSSDYPLATRWASWLEWEGFDAVFCPGPGVVRCSRLAGLRCGFRELADVAIVDVQYPTTSQLYEQPPARSCTTDPDDDRTIFILDRRFERGCGGRLGLRHPVGRSGFLLTVRTLVD